MTKIERTNARNIEISMFKNMKRGRHCDPERTGFSFSALIALSTSIDTKETMKNSGHFYGT